MRYFFKISLILIVAMIVLVPNGIAGSSSASASGSASADADGAQASSSASASGGGESDSTSSQASGSSASSTSSATASDNGVTVRSESSPSVSINDDSSDNNDDSDDNGNGNTEDTDTIYDETEIGVVDCNSVILSDDPNERCKKIKINIRADDNTDASGVAITIEEPTIGIEVGEAIAEVTEKEEENIGVIAKILKFLNL